MKIRVLHVGVGIRGRHWIDFARDHADFESVGCVDAAPPALEAAREALGGKPGWADLAEALGAVEADVALIASPSFLHAEHAMRALDAGLAVLVEKPFTCTVEEAAGVMDRARAAQKPVVVAENFRFVPAERTIRHAVREGLLGALSNATLVDRRRMPASTQGRWMAEIDFPQLQEIAVHHFDSLRSFFGEPRSIVARTWNPPSDYAHGSSTEALIEMEGGPHVQYLGSLTSHKFSWTLSVEGEQGLLWSNRKWVLWRPKGAKLFRPLKKVPVRPGDEAPYPKEGTTSLLEGLRDALRGTPAETRADDNVRTIALMEAGKRSDREGRPVAVDELLPGAAEA